MRAWKHCNCWSLSCDGVETLQPVCSLGGTGPLRNVVCYEGKSNAHKRRAFHSLTIESKNAWKIILDPVSQYQALNSASQSLHNMYEFFDEAGPKHLAKSF